MQRHGVVERLFGHPDRHRLEECARIRPDQMEADDAVSRFLSKLGAQRTHFPLAERTVIC
jgi:hypothetical protein